MAAGRSPKGLEEARVNGADAIISLDQDHDSLVAAFRKEIAENGVDVCSTISRDLPRRHY